MLFIAFLQQEFVLMPELQNLDLIGEDAKAELLAKYQKWRWLSFITVPLLLLFHLSLVSSCLFIGHFFFAEMSGVKFKDWWGVAMIAQAVMILYSVILCTVNVAAGANKALEVTKYTSLLFLGGDDIENWVRVPLSAVNVFEVAYWLVMAKLVNVRTDTGFGKSFKFVVSSYGVGNLLYIALLMYLILYLN